MTHPAGMFPDEWTGHTTYGILGPKSLHHARQRPRWFARACKAAGVAMMAAAATLALPLAARDDFSRPEPHWLHHRTRERVARGVECTTAK